MKSGTPYSQGDIILVPFPFTNLMAVKRRPVLILSKGEYNSKADDVITCGITSNINDSNHSVIIDNTDLIEGSIPLQSRIKVDKLFTLEQSIVIKKLGKVNTNIFESVKKELHKLID